MWGNKVLTATSTLCSKIKIFKKDLLSISSSYNILVATLLKLSSHTAKLGHTSSYKRSGEYDFMCY